MKKLTNMFVRARRALPLQIVVLILIIGVISCTDKSWPDEEDIASSSSGGILNISSGSVLDNSSSSGDSGSSSGSSSSGTGGPSSSSSAEALPIANLPVKFNEVFIASNWVELYNPADTAFNLRGYALINHAEGNLWFFDNATIQPRGYLTVFLSGTNAVRGDSIHLPFQLSRMGGDLYLMNSQREIADHIEYPAETLPTLSFSKNITTGQWALCRPTPNSQNSNECYNGQASVPTGLPPSGHYASGHSFILPAESSNGTIRCETNGNAPTANSPFQSGHQFNLTATTVLRCAQFRAGALPSEAIMRTYIIGRLPSLPIVSIAVDPWRMFDAPNQALYRSSTGNLNCGGGGGGFYTDSIVPIHLDFFESNADHKWSHGAEIKIHGGCSRMHPKKSVIISFRREHGLNRLNYPLFPSHPHLTNFKHFMLRNNGNNYTYDYIRDMLMSSLTEGLDVDYQKGRSVVVYYNGNYFGIHNLRERANSDFIETNFGINENTIDFIDADVNRRDGDNERKGSDADYQDILRWLGCTSTGCVGNSASASSLSDFDLRALEQRMDLDNFTNHFQSRIYYNDRDWPGKNLKRWRAPSSAQYSRWRWLLYDTDHGWGGYGIHEQSWLSSLQFATRSDGPSWPNPPHSTFMLRKLLTNESYKNGFINRFSLLIATYFAPTRVNARVDALTAPIRTEIPFDQDRWNNRGTSIEGTAIRAWGNARPAIMHSELRSFFNLGSPVDLTLTANGNGRILVHNLPVLNGNATFNAYPSVPITIKAVPNGSATFRSWSDGNTSAERTVTITQATTLRADF